MEYGIVNQTLAALRCEPFMRSEMVSQLLFGELFTVLEQHREWFKVIVQHDQYEGWINSRSCMLMDKVDFELLLNPLVTRVATRLFSAQRKGDDFPIRLCPGSTLYNFDESKGTFLIPKHTYKTPTVPFDMPKHDLREELVRLASQFVNSPYLWGGRSPYGIDCSGFTQVVFKMLGHKIPRDAGQQVALGQPVDFLNLAQPGDLAFFDNQDGIITHVGIILSATEIVHSSGFVRIDTLDHQGIFDGQSKTYSHRLRVIKNLLSHLT